MGMIGIIIAMIVAGAFGVIVYRNYNVYIRYSDADPQCKRLYLIIGMGGSVILGTVLGVLINFVIYLFHH
jgi:hypothetical protein